MTKEEQDMLSLTTATHKKIYDILNETMAKTDDIEIDFCETGLCLGEALMTEVVRLLAPSLFQLSPEGLEEFISQLTEDFELKLWTADVKYEQAYQKEYAQ